MAGLNNKLGKIGTRELRSLFGTYGDIDNILIDRDSDGRSKGVAFITYRKHRSAKEAIIKMDKILIKE